MDRLLERNGQRAPLFVARTVQPGGHRALASRDRQDFSTHVRPDRAEELNVEQIQTLVEELRKAESKKAEA